MFFRFKYEDQNEFITKDLSKKYKKSQFDGTPDHIKNHTYYRFKDYPYYTYENIHYQKFILQMVKFL